MAAVNFGRYEAAPSAPMGRTQRMVNLAGAGTSLLLVIGVLVWGYRLAMRDVNGIPVIKAVQGPMRIAPEDPGGQISDNVGLTVNRVEADAKGLPQTDKIVLAPQPAALGPGDLSPEALAKAQAAAKVQLDRLAADAAAQAGQTTVVPPQSAGTPQPAVTPNTAAPAARTGTPAQTAAIAPAQAAPSASISSGGDPFAAPAPTTSTTVAPKAVATAQTQAPAPRPATADMAASPAAPAASATASAAAPAPKLTANPVSAMAPVASPVPRFRPAVVPPAPAAPAAAAVASASVADAVAMATQAIAPAARAPAAVPASIEEGKLRPGTHLVQVGAFLDQAQAVAAWAHLKARFPDLMADKSRVIQKAESGGRAFYRLRAYGFKTAADTRRFCAAFDAENANCVPVIVR